MKKRILFLFVLSMLSYFGMAQMYVTSNGNIGIGTTTPSCKFQINSSTNSNNFTFKPSNSGHLEIGGYNGYPNSMITFWHSSGGFNQLTAKSFSKSSDSTLKSNVQRLENPINTIKRINGYSYFYRENPFQRENKDYGVIAQEVERVLPELVSTIKGIKVVDYDALIPFLIEAIKEQQDQIEALEQELSLIREFYIPQNDEFRGKQSQNLILDGQSDKLQLFQNAPNPFNTITTIKCYIPDNISNSQLCIYDMKGNLVQCHSIHDKGYVDLQIQAGSLSAGIYAYVLIGDGQTSETKQMVLTK